MYQLEDLGLSSVYFNTFWIDIIAEKDTIQRYLNPNKNSMYLAMLNKLQNSFQNQFCKDNFIIFSILKNIINSF